MSIKYKLVLRKDLSKGAAEGDKKYYASVNNNGTFSFDDLCESVSAISTASRGDVLVVMDGALSVMKNALLRGEIVQFGELGNFQINTGSKGVATAEEFKTNLIRKARIIFRPGAVLKDTLGKVNYERIGKDAASSEGGGSGEEERPGEL